MKTKTLKLTKPQQELYDELRRGRKIRVWDKGNTFEYHFDHGNEFVYDLVRYRVFWNVIDALAKQKAQENNDPDFRKYAKEISKQYFTNADHLSK